MGAKWTPEGLLTQEQAGVEVVETNSSNIEDSARRRSNGYRANQVLNKPVRKVDNIEG